MTQITPDTTGWMGRYTAEVRTASVSDISSERYPSETTFRRGDSRVPQRETESGQQTRQNAVRPRERWSVGASVTTIEQFTSNGDQHPKRQGTENT
ncbi:MAG: hypothetical protein A07HR60_01578 [uncultured archaeon A07HR60]|nr:MAG: hypothetical protein A07HR60_01578 [uncultured archaeon A07HR60]